MGPLLVVLAATATLATCPPDTAGAAAVASLGQSVAAAAKEPPRAGIVHLFEWTWPDIATECEKTLGPMGVEAVQISPPQESAVVPGHPWWERYQPVSYKLDSRSGTREQLADMIRRCDAAGVKIYADVVLNHMSGNAEGTGIAGTKYTLFDYPGTYGYGDFHHYGADGNERISNVGDLWQAWNLSLLGLADLDTGSEKVRATEAAYLNDLISLGVAGFRVDAAYHIHWNDLEAVWSKLSKPVYLYDEVSFPTTAHEYARTADVTEFRYGFALAKAFGPGGQLLSLEHLGGEAGWAASDKAIVFVDNHDTERMHNNDAPVLDERNGRVYELANEFMLAWPYGKPQILSGFKFESTEQGPPSDAEGRTTSVFAGGAACSAGWTCVHRAEWMQAMLGFRRRAGSAPVAHWWSNGPAAAFAREGKGFVAFNHAEGALSQRLQTGLPAGRYGDLLDPSQTITVAPDGTAEVQLAPNGSLAIDLSSKR